MTTWAWVDEPRAKQPLDRPFAWALVQLDGADTAMLHAVDAGSASRACAPACACGRAGAPSRVGDIHDIACFEPEAER